MSMIICVATGCKFIITGHTCVATFSLALMAKSGSVVLGLEYMLKKIACLELKMEYCVSVKL